MGHYVAEEIKLEARVNLDAYIQLFKYIYVCNKTQPLTSNSVTVTIGQAK